MFPRCLLVFFVLFGCLFSVVAHSKDLRPGDIDVRFGSKKCGESGLYAKKKIVVYLIVVGNSGTLRCAVVFKEKYLRHSDFVAGYACVSAYEAKKAEIVSEGDARVLREKNYADSLRLAKTAAARMKLDVIVVYITTSRGPPFDEPRCKSMLAE